MGKDAAVTHISQERRMPAHRYVQTQVLHICLCGRLANPYTFFEQYDLENLNKSQITDC